MTQTVTYVNIMLAARQEARRLGHAFVGVEHVFIALCRLGGFTERLLAGEGIDPRSVSRAIQREVDRQFLTGERAGIHFTPRLRAILARISPDAANEMTAEISEPRLFWAIVEESESIPMRVLERMEIDLRAILARHGDPTAPAPRKETPVEDTGKEEGKGYRELMRFGRDLTQLAREGRIHPAIGRDEEIEQLERTLLRATKSNPVLVGEAGVGKTAIVEGLAHRIVHGRVVDELVGKRIIEINLAQVTAGTKYRGAFEENLIRIIEAARDDPDIILAMDELHTLVGAGNAPGRLDASNVLKPALARGEIRLIGATTREEYRKHIEPDAALERRFQVITVEEPTPADSLEILSGIRERFERHHQVTVDPDTLQAAVDLSVRFLPARRLPDKAIDLLDEACAHARVHAHTSSNGRKSEEDGVRVVRVSADQVATVLGEWTGLPVTDLTRELRGRLIGMPDRLGERVLGQEEAVGVVTRAMETALTGLRRGTRPVAVLLFVGPTGVGKTELAKALTEFLFGSEDEMIRLDMSEYQERHQVAKLIGAPPGYIGHDEAGALTERLHDKPYSVVLLDEVEKAHADVFDVFLQLFDDGRLTDAHGRTADGRHAIFIMTSNLGSELYDTGRGIGFTDDRARVPQRHEIVDRCKRFFRPEFINRIDEIVVFKPLSQAHLQRIVDKLVTELLRELERKDIRLSMDPDAAALLAEAGYEPMYGARPLRRAFERMVVHPVAHRIVSGEFSKGDLIRVSARDGTLKIDCEQAP